MRTLTRGFVRMLSKQMMRLKARNSELCFWKTGEILNLKTRMRNPSKKCQISCPKGSRNEGVLNKMRMLQVRCISIKVQLTKQTDIDAQTAISYIIDESLDIITEKKRIRLQESLLQRKQRGFRGKNGQVIGRSGHRGGRWSKRSLDGTFCSFSNIWFSKHVCFGINGLVLPTIMYYVYCGIIEMNDA